MCQQLTHQGEAVCALKDELATSQHEQQQSAEVSLLHIQLGVSSESSMSLCYSSTVFTEEPLNTAKHMQLFTHGCHNALQLHATCR